MGSFVITEAIAYKTSDWSLNGTDSASDTSIDDINRRGDIVLPISRFQDYKSAKSTSYEIPIMHFVMTAKWPATPKEGRAQFINRARH